MKLALIMAEHGRPAPDVSQYRECWPEADIQVFSGNDLPETLELDPQHPRYGWRQNDYHKVRKMLDSGADIAMSFDSDMWIVDMQAAQALPTLADRFGACLPMNPRCTVLRDAADGADVPDDAKLRAIHDPDWSCFGPSMNCSPIAINLRSHEGVQLAEEYCRVMLETPMRGPLAWWKAMMRRAWAPLVLPPQFCVCERHIGIGGEIILHHGHEAVKRHYGNRRIS